MEPIPESSKEGESSEATLLDDVTALSPQHQVLRSQLHMSLVCIFYRPISNCIVLSLLYIFLHFLVLFI